jgi:DNA (cytosine-5)-methyltransferase 1
MSTEGKAKAYYNEIDPFCASWLRELIKAGLIADGDVDERSIEDVKPNELRGFRQHHFFAGCGGWPIALRLAGWPDEEPIITGSCPCEPFSCAGKGIGIEDKRHLWPAFRWIISQIRPSRIAGEQVAVGAMEWMSGVQVDLEALNYEVETYDIPAYSVGAWHQRRRFFWVAYTDSTRWPRQRQAQSEKWRDYFISAWKSTEAPYTDSKGWENFKRGKGPSESNWREKPVSRNVGCRLHQWEVEPDLVCVVHGVSSNSRAVSAYGRAIVPQVAAEVIKAFMDIQ